MHSQNQLEKTVATSRKIDAGFFDSAWVDNLVGQGGQHYVMLFLYLVITCRNNVGIFECNPRLWNFKLNPPTPFKADDVFKVFGNRIRRIQGHPDKGIVVGFCDFQRNYSKQSAQWQWVEKDLEAVSLTYEDLKRYDDEANEVQPELNLDLPPKPVKHREAKVVDARNQIPPTLEMVSAYCSTRNNGIDPQGFIDFYSSKGWKVGDQPMKDWQAAVRTWEQRRKADNPGRSETLVKNITGTVRRKF